MYLYKGQCEQDVPQEHTEEISKCDNYNISPHSIT